MRRGPKVPEGRDDQIVSLAEAGFSRLQICEKLNVNYDIVARVIRRCGVVALDTRGQQDKQRHDADRAAVMASRYASGQTLQQIADAYKISRERVRQILRKYTAVKSKDGGAALRWARRREERATIKDQKYMDRLGCGWEEYKRIRQIGKEFQAKGGSRDRSPMGAFCRQKYNASKRGIGWDLTFWQWWSIWQASGRWSQRGRGQGYVICRRGDVGPYSVSNVFIATAIENIASSKVKKSGLPIGVRAQGKRFCAKRCIDGRIHELGSFATPQEAYAAYLAAAPGFQHGEIRS